MRTEGLLTQSQQLTGRAPVPAERAPADQRGAGHQGEAARRAERRGGTEERARSSRPAGALEEKAAELALTSKYKSEFLRQHVATSSARRSTPSSSCSQQLADNAAGNLVAASRSSSPGTSTPPGPTSCTSSTTSSTCRRSSPAPSPSRSRRSRSPACGTRSSATSGTWPRAKNLPFQRPRSPRTCRPCMHPATPSGSSRSSRTCCRTPSSSPTHGHVDMPGRASPPTGWRPDHPVLSKARSGGRLRRGGHRHRRRAREAAADLRGVPAGGRRHRPQVRRRRAWASPSAASWRACCGGEIRLASVPGRGQHLHALSAGPLLPARTAAGSSGPAPVAASRAATVAALHAVAARGARSSTTGTSIAEGDPDAPHHRGRPALRPDPPGAGARTEGFKGIVATRGASGLPLARRYRPDGHLARHLPARHAGLDGPQHSSSSIRRRATSRCRSSPWRKSGSTGSRTGRSPTSSSRPRPRTWKRRSTGSRTSPSPRTKRLLVVEDNAASSGTRSSSSPGPRRHRALGGLDRRARR